MHPDPPHLSAFVLPARDSTATLVACVEVLTTAGCAFAGEVETARERTPFRFVSDLPRDGVRPTGALDDVAASGCLLRVALRHRSLGAVLLGLAPTAELGERHPIAVSVHAGPLGLPATTWSDEDRREAARVWQWMQRTMLLLAEGTDALYGAMGVESVFPTPRGLTGARESAALDPPTWFWSSRLSRAAAAQESSLLASLPSRAVERAPEGVVFHGWRPGSDDVADPEAAERIRGFLARAVSDALAG